MTTYTSVVEISNAADEMYLFPNPCNNVLHMHIPDNISADYNYSIYNLTGQKVSENKLTANNSISIAHLPTGSYLMVVYNKDHVFKKLLSILHN